MKDLYADITNQIIAAIEAGEANPEGWHMPWHRFGQAIGAPLNAITKRAYRGVNVICLWASAQANGYSSGLWATYKQWTEMGAQVRKGEMSTMVVFYKQMGTKDDEETETKGDSFMMARAYYVFNAAQVDGFEEPELPKIGEAEMVTHAESLIAATGARIIFGGSRAYYSPALDEIHIPAREAFRATTHSSATEGLYTTIFHELAHWTGSPSRCNRDLSGRFKSEAYAAEELVAELASAMMAGEIGISIAPRLDHAQYVAGWLRALKDDRRAIFTAASLAQKAADFITAFSQPQQVAEAAE